jgi:WS/DGAT/MGAT family acyltransferase
MSHYKYDRLSAQDTSFLIFEKPNINMHVASTAIYKAGSLKKADGGIDFERIKKAVGDILHRIPRYRQKMMWIQENKTAVWVDDAQFNIDYHVRHTSLPKPGNAEQLKTLASRVTEVQLDRERPLWEMWIVEGLEGDRFALINKIHHSMIDGSSGVELSQVLMSPDKNFIPDEPPVYYPRPIPTKAELRRDEYERFIRLPWQAAKNFQQFRSNSQDFYGELFTRANALKETFMQIGTPSENPLNGPLGPHRILDWVQMPLEDIKQIRRGLGCTVNDIVLTIVTGAVRNFFLNRQVHPEDITYRVATPVSVRRDEEKGKMGNRVSAWSVRLPIEESNPGKQLEKLVSQTQEMKESQQALGVEMMMALAEWTPSLLTLGARAGGASNNSIVTNVPGPQFPLYLIGAEMEEIYPCVPLMERMGLGIALMSYQGKLCWGFNGDYGQVSDIANFIKQLKKSTEALAKIAGVELSEEYYGGKRPALPKPAAKPAAKQIEKPAAKPAPRKRKATSSAAKSATAVEAKVATETKAVPETKAAPETKATNDAVAAKPEKAAVASK